MKSTSKVVVITGASKGIGLATTRALLEKKINVVATARSFTQNLLQLKEKFPNNLTLVEVDVGQSQQIESLRQKLESLITFDNELILINNAGISGGGPLELISEQFWKDIFQINVLGLVSTTRILLPLLRKTKGRIINIGSISGRIASPFLSPYSGTKFAVRGITDSLRRELLNFGVKVILVEPGPFKTDIWDSSIERTRNDLDSRKNTTDSNQGSYGVYTEAITQFEVAVKKVVETAENLDSLIEKILHACLAGEPHNYYLAGRNLKLQILLTQILPSKVVDKLLSGGLRFTK